MSGAEGGAVSPKQAGDFCPCEEFRMPALGRRMSLCLDAAGVRKSPKNETAGRKGIDVAAAAYGDLRCAGVARRVIETSIKDDLDGLGVAIERLPSVLQ